MAKIDISKIENYASLTLWNRRLPTLQRLRAGRAVTSKSKAASKANSELKRQLKALHDRG